MAEDIASEVFLDVWRHADGFKANSQASTWLLAIARAGYFNSDEILACEEAGITATHLTA